MTLTWIDFANARIEGIASPACSSPLIIIALICDVICSYIGLLALLLMMISITHRLYFYNVLNVQVHYNTYLIIVNPQNKIVRYSYQKQLYLTLGIGGLLSIKLLCVTLPYMSI